MTAHDVVAGLMGRGQPEERRAPRVPRWYQSRLWAKLALVIAAPVAVAAARTWQPVSRRELGDSLRVERAYTDSLHREEREWSNQIIENLLSVNAMVCEQTRTSNRRLYETVTRTNPRVHCP